MIEYSSRAYTDNYGGLLGRYGTSPLAYIAHKNVAQKYFVCSQLPHVLARGKGVACGTNVSTTRKGSSSRADTPLSTHVLCCLSQLVHAAARPSVEVSSETRSLCSRCSEARPSLKGRGVSLTTFPYNECRLLFDTLLRGKNRDEDRTTRGQYCNP
jgi:hypothetical protein